MTKVLETKLVVSFKSSSIDLSVVDYENKIPSILFTTKNLLLSNKQLTPNEFVEISLKSLQKMLVDNSFELKKHLKESNKCEIIFHSPWYLAELISEQHSEGKKGLKQFFLEKVKPPKQNDYLQIENKITNIILNGYQLTKLRDVEGDEIQINIYRSFVSQSSIIKIKEIIKNEFRQFCFFEFSTSAMMIYETIKNIFVDEDNCIFINIGGEITEIGVIEDDILVDFMTIPIGIHFFQRELETFLTDKKILDTIKFLSNNKTDENLNPKNNEMLSTTVKNWVNEVFEIFLNQKKEFPKKVFVFTNSTADEFFKMIFKNNETLKNFEFSHVIYDTFSSRMNIPSNGKVDIEFLLSSYYLSVKS